MIPLKDTIPSRTFPFVNYLLIAINIICFFYQLSLGPYVQHFISLWGVVPLRVTTLQGDFYQIFSPFITSMFLHGGWLHVLGNMLYLYIFGDNVEDRLGHVRYLIFYLLCGICASVTQVLAAPYARIPMVGASGAIAGVMGAYFCMFPYSRIVTLVFIFFFIEFIEIPAFFFLLFWFVLQFLNGTLSFSTQNAAGGVAWWAHIGGFVAGILLLLVFRRKRRYRIIWS
ncbi:MAG: rhomboid family intramembrane serine protease [Desulfobacterota bacterium]|nr:rhomboid family intramembrane serine protease [Thermodesulfobacteriota bacterium]